MVTYPRESLVAEVGHPGVCEAAGVIVSHRHRYIFLKTKKTGGTSLEAALLPHCGPKDLVAASIDFDPVDRPFLRTVNPGPRAMRGSQRFKRIVGRTPLVPAWRLSMHASARHVRAVVGEDVWGSYRKITIERNPWDRMISLWKWRSRLGPMGFDEFLDSLENDEPNHRAFGHESKWSNWPIYTIDDRVVADDVIEHARLNADAAALLADMGIPADPLPAMKAGYRSAGDRVSDLTAEQVERIARLHRREIALFGYEP
jgi:hypothetical protein